MPSAQQCAERLREQAYRTLLPQIRDLEQELRKVSSSLSDGVQQIERKLEGLSRVELPTTEMVLQEILGDVTRENELKTSSLLRFAHSLRLKDTQEEILSLLLDAALEYHSRAALFVVRGDRLVGWSSRGCSEASARKISSFSVLRSDCPESDGILEGGNPAAGAGSKDGDPLQFLDEEFPGARCLVPLCVLRRPVALLIGGGAAWTQREADALSILAEFTVLRLENIALKILYELAAAKPGMAQPARETAAAEPAAYQPDSHEARFARPASEPPVYVPAPEPEYRLEFSREPEPAAEPLSFADAGDSFAAVPVQAEVPASAAEPEPEPPKPESQEARPTEEEKLHEKLHSDAKRFARLLVSEIKLYNEHHVAEGRENRDLYLRLKRDIDRSREMYEKRVSPTVSQKIDYFHDEIIRILGDNDPSTLGSDYPGPRVEES